MRQLKTGEFFGDTDQTLKLDGLTLTDTVYTHSHVDWHYHEHAYFTFILQGTMLEGNRKEVFHCSPGSLLYHYHQEPHYNVKPNVFTRGFHIELEPSWFSQFDLPNIEGSLNIKNPDAKVILYQLFREMKINDSYSRLAIEGLLLRSFDNDGRKPKWVPRLKEILNEEVNISLEYLSKEIGLHPIHISRVFAKYFNCTMGEYLRKIKVERSMALLPDTELSLTEIAFSCGFADQSHFIRCFKDVYNTKPSTYRKLFAC